MFGSHNSIISVFLDFVVSTSPMPLITHIIVLIGYRLIRGFITCEMIVKSCRKSEDELNRFNRYTTTPLASIVENIYTDVKKKPFSHTFEWSYCKVNRLFLFKDFTISSDDTSPNRKC